MEKEKFGNQVPLVFSTKSSLDTLRNLNTNKKLHFYSSWERLTKHSFYLNNLQIWVNPAAVSEFPF